MTGTPITTAADALAAGLLPAAAAILAAMCAHRCLWRGEAGMASLYGLLALLMGGIAIVVPWAWWPT